MIGRADLILSGVQGPITPAQKRSLELLIGHAERLAAELDGMATRFDDFVRGGPASAAPEDPEAE